MEKVTLYDLTESYLNVLALLDDVENEELKKTLDDINEQIEIKADNIAKILKENDGKIETLDREIKRLTAKKSAMQNNAKYLKQYLQEEMLKVGKVKIKTALFSFNISKNRPSLKIENEEFIPEEFYKIEKKLSLTDLTNYIKDGNEIKGCELIQTESLKIR